MNGRRKRVLRTARLVVLVLIATLLAAMVAVSDRPSPNGSTIGADVGAPAVVLWTMMRSGSQMSQSLLTAQPCSFLTEEPLRHLEKQDLNASVSLLQDLFACRVSAHPDYLKEWMNGSHINDARVKNLCQAFPRLCWDGRLVDALCKASCLKLVRVVAEGLALALSVLQDSSFNTHIVHLVRDPRGMLSSRRDLQEGRFNRFFMMSNATFFRNDEMELSVLCQRYRHDLAVATHMARHYCDRYTLVRYEDIARQPHRETRRLYSFMGLEYTPLVASVVSKQTLGFYHTEGKDHPFATSKNSSSIVFAWRSRLSYSEVERVQQECGDVLRAYGYRHFTRRQYEKEVASPLLPLPAGWANPIPANREDT
ncbi:carbohydrate sulfotransferase 4-like isoform X2 [Portunus trituberculatus]|uniref:carbohydrate sulfotransferase 4-like isoform X2 n=1 Tax=Portunus trituberculatus TaxID=210409 RepID=UPI001E1CE9E4|nr:carbohydrate sulfotransferase 4-like isoform X2 [Portunus trituberculatus]